MPFTEEQQASLEMVTETEMVRHKNLLELETRRAKLELVRLAKEVLIENARSKPVDSRDVSADDIKSYAQSLVNYING